MATEETKQEETQQEDRDMLQKTINIVADETVDQLKKTGKVHIAIKSISDYKLDYEQEHERAKSKLIEELKARGLKVKVTDDDTLIVDDGSKDSDDVSAESAIAPCKLIIAGSELKISSSIDGIKSLYDKSKDLDIDDLRKRMAYNEIALMAKEIALSVDWINEQCNQIDLVRYIEKERKE